MRIGPINMPKVVSEAHATINSKVKQLSKDDNDLHDVFYASFEGEGVKLHEGMKFKDFKPVKNADTWTLKAGDVTAYLIRVKKTSQGIEIKAGAEVAEKIEEVTKQGGPITVQGSSKEGKALEEALRNRDFSVVALSDEEYQRMFHATTKAFEHAAENKKRPFSDEALKESVGGKDVTYIPRRDERAGKTGSTKKASEEEAYIIAAAHKDPIEAQRKIEEKANEAEAERLREERLKDQQIEEKLRELRIEDIRDEQSEG